MSATLHCGDVRAVLAGLPAASVQVCVTSPPYFGLRDYGVPGQIGLEKTPAEYVASMVGVFQGVRRVLRDDGVLWLNLGDSYANDAKWGGSSGGKHVAALHGDSGVGRGKRDTGLKPKDLMGIPWRVAFALQADGWYLRSDIIWSKPNPMPESVTDRPTKAHEYLFLLTKSERYYYDSAAIAEPVVSSDADIQRARILGRGDQEASRHYLGTPQRDKSGGFPVRDKADPSRNARTVWTITTQPYGGAHFATFPEELARRCILAGSKPGDAVLDPFGGSGTTAAVAVGHGRNAIHIDLNPAYIALARQRIGPMLCEGAA